MNKRSGTWLTVLSSLYFALLLTVFFLTLYTANSDWSWGDMDHIHQGLYNFWHGRHYQSSIYRIPASGEVSSPFAYTHEFTIHINLVHYFMVALHKFIPTLGLLYWHAILYNVLGVMLFAYLFIKKPSRDTSSLPISEMAIFALLTWGTFYSTISYKCHITVFATPWFLASYYFLKKKNYGLFWLLGIAVILVEEDCALWMFMYGLYLVIWEDERHPLVYALLVMGLAEFLAVSFWIQPAAKSYLPARRFGSDLTMTLNLLVFDRLAEWRAWCKELFSYLLQVLLAMSYPFAWIWTLKQYTPIKKQELALILFVPLPFWAALLIGRGSLSMFIPVIGSFLIVMLQMLERISRTPWKLHPDSWKYGVLLAVCFVLPNQSLAIQTSILLRSYGIVHAAHYTPSEMLSNRDTLAGIETLPRSGTLCYWTSRNIGAFIAHRSDLWRFPYAFNKTDYLVIQKGTDNSNFAFLQNPASVNLTALAEDDASSPEKKTNLVCNGGFDCHISASDVEFFRDLLVTKQKTHVVWKETDHYVIFKNIQPIAIERPAFTETWYWRPRHP